MAFQKTALGDDSDENPEEDVGLLSALKEAAFAAVQEHTPHQLTLWNTPEDSIAFDVALNATRGSLLLRMYLLLKKNVHFKRFGAGIMKEFQSTSFFPESDVVERVIVGLRNRELRDYFVERIFDPDVEALLQQVEVESETDDTWQRLAHIRTNAESMRERLLYWNQTDYDDFSGWTAKKTPETPVSLEQDELLEQSNNAVNTLASMVMQSLSERSAEFAKLFYPTPNVSSLLLSPRYKKDRGIHVQLDILLEQKGVVDNLLAHSGESLYRIHPAVTAQCLNLMQEGDAAEMRALLAGKMQEELMAILQNGEGHALTEETVNEFYEQMMTGTLPVHESDLFEYL